MERHEFPYFVKVSHRVGESGGWITFVSKGLQQPVNADGSFRVVPTYRVVIGGTLEEPTFDWSQSPLEPAEERIRLEAEASVRLQERSAWLTLVRRLMNDAEAWAKELGWSTRQADKILDDERFGKHRVPVLILQVDTLRLMLEPIGSSAPEAGGIAELYRMPAYDDIARLVSDGGEWRVLMDGHPYSEHPEAECEDKVFTKDTLDLLASWMPEHAG